MKNIKKILAAAVGTIAIAAFVTVFALFNAEASSIIQIDSEQTIKNSEEYLKSMDYSEEEFNNKWGKNSEHISYISKNNNSIYIDQVCTEKYQYENCTVIMLPQYNCDYTSLLKTADFFLENGVNVVMFDQRGHGRNDAEKYTFGLLEADDLYAVVEYFDYNISTSVPLGIYTQGASSLSAINYLSGYDELTFVIFEDPYASASECVKDIISEDESIFPESVRQTRIPAMISSKYNLSLQDNLYELSEHINIPVLMLSHTNSEKCPYASAEKLYNSFPYKYDLVTFSDSELLHAISSETEKYKEAVLPFIEQFKY